MPDIMLEAFVRKLAQIAEAKFRKDGSLSPIFIGDRKTGERVIFPIDTGMTKDQAADAMRIVAEEMELVRCCLIDEIWFVERDVTKMNDAERNAELDRINRDGVSGEADRREAIAFFAEDLAGAIMGRCEIFRKNGEVSIGRLQIQRCRRIEGRFVGVLPSKAAAN